MSLVSIKIKSKYFNAIDTLSTLKKVSYYLCGIKLVAILFFSKFNNKNEQPPSSESCSLFNSIQNASLY